MMGNQPGPKPSKSGELETVDKLTDEGFLVDEDPGMFVFNALTYEQTNNKKG
jgi:hypothetical protein